MKLGYTPDWATGGELAPPKAKDEPPVYHPGFSVEGKAGKKLADCLDGQLGETITATVKLKVTSLSQDSSHGSNGKQESCRVGFEILELDCPELKGDHYKEEDAGEAMDKHRQKP